MKVHFDISQLVREPRRSGIQRAERELIRHWPGPAGLAPCRFDPASGAMRALPQAIFDVLCQDAPSGGVAEELGQLQPYLAAPGPVVEGGARLLCAELFADAARAAFYRGKGGIDAFWLLYDFLPWLRPEWFAAGPATALMPYLQAARAVPNVAFISAATRRDFSGRILRRECGGPVIGLGADGLGMPPQRFAPERLEFVVLGTIEPRKNAAAAMCGFRQLWAEGVEAGLTLIGVVEQDALAEQALLRELHAQGRFRHGANLPDEGVRAVLAGARALLFPSEGEGYGLPAVEALHAGIPVIVSAGLPALEGLPGAGQVRLPEVSPEAIADAVRMLMDDAAAARIWAQARTLQLPSWRDFARSVADWVQGDRRIGG